jgi:hypothetical protein
METLSPNILIVGASTGGVAAALAASEAGATVCLLEETDWPGGQLTTQGVCTPDENPWIETFGSTRRYAEFRQAVRAFYRTHYQLTPEAATNPKLNPGNCWVSRLSFEPKVGVEILRDFLRRWEDAGNLRCFFGGRIETCEMDGDTLRTVLARTADGVAFQFTPRYVLDATDTGDLLALCGKEGEDWVVGAESRTETGEPDTPDIARLDWVQPFTFPFALEWSPETAETNVITPPNDYAELKALQNYHTIHGAITGIFTGKYPWWSYRRVLAKENFDDPRVPADLAMINTAGNDYYGGNILGANAGSAEDIEATLAHARRVSLGYVYWLQAECPREGHREQETGNSEEQNQNSPLPCERSERIREGGAGGLGNGYPELRLRTDIFDTEDGCSLRPYIRESRRIRARRAILEQEIVVKDFAGNVCRGDLARAAFMADTVGIGHYALDIHPNGHGEPNHFVATRPFQIPLGALIPLRWENLLPACKNIGTTHLSNGAYRLHPIEWNIGESAGRLAAFCVEKGVAPSEVYEDAALRRAFQTTLLREGIPLHWYTDVPREHPAFLAVQTLAGTGLSLGSETDLLFHPDEPMDAETYTLWRETVGGETPAAFTGTRADAARTLVKV